MQYALTSVKAPTYAPDGSQGYQIIVAWSGIFTNPVDGDHRRTGQLFGWVSQTSDSNEVIATVGGEPWVTVSTDSVVLSEDWVWQHGSDIIDHAIQGK